MLFILIKESPFLMLFKPFDNTTKNTHQWLYNAGGSATNGRHFYITSGVTPSQGANVSGYGSFTLHNTSNDNINTIFLY